MKLGVLPSFTGFSRFYRALPDFEWIFHLIHLKKKWKNEGHIVVIGSFKKKTESISKAKAESIAHPTIFQKLFTTLPSFFFHFFVVVVVEDTTKKKRSFLPFRRFFLFSLSLSLSLSSFCSSRLLLSRWWLFFGFISSEWHGTATADNTTPTARRTARQKKRGRGGTKENKKIKERKKERIEWKKNQQKETHDDTAAAVTKRKKKKKGTTIMTHNININI